MMKLISEINSLDLPLHTYAVNFGFRHVIWKTPIFMLTLMVDFMYMSLIHEIGSTYESYIAIQHHWCVQFMFTSINEETPKSMLH